MAGTHSGLVARRYAAVLLDMADKARLLEKIEKDVLELGGMIEKSADLAAVLSNPLVGCTKQGKAVLAVADKAGFQSLTRNFLGVLARNRRLSLTKEIVAAFHEDLSRRRGQIEAKVQCAFAPSTAQADALQKELTRALGSNVTLNIEIDRDLLGGMVVVVGSTMIDDSVKRKLERLKRAMTESKAA